MKKTEIYRRIEDLKAEVDLREKELKSFVNSNNFDGSQIIRMCDNIDRLF